MQRLISKKIGQNTPGKVINRPVVQGIAIYLIGIVAAYPVALSFTQLISTRIDGVKLQHSNEIDRLAGGCRRKAGTRGPCSPPSPWG
ncbi:MAG TPA: hypothetical protein V6D28_23865 [Leptolyngbyaceae cyanobacterium]